MREARPGCHTRGDLKHVPISKKGEQLLELIDKTGLHEIVAGSKWDCEAELLERRGVIKPLESGFSKRYKEVTTIYVRA